jgi:hypothetical protein
MALITMSSPLEAAPNKSLPRGTEEKRTRVLISAGAVLAVLGVAFAVNDDDVGKWLTLAGVIALIVGLHRFGRLGTDEAT